MKRIKNESKAKERKRNEGNKKGYEENKRIIMRKVKEIGMRKKW